MKRPKRLLQTAWNVLQVFEAFADPDLEQTEKWIVAIYLLFECFSCADDVLQATEDGFNVGEAIQQISWFITAGAPDRKKIEELPMYSWQKDEQMIFAAVNKVAGRETRELEYLHWWTFLGYFNEIGEGNFSFIVGIRHKLNHNKKLEKHEREFLNNNRELIKLDPPKTREQLAEEAERHSWRWRTRLAVEASGLQLCSFLQSIAQSNRPFAF